MAIEKLKISATKYREKYRTPINEKQRLRIQKIKAIEDAGIKNSILTYSISNTLFTFSWFGDKIYCDMGLGKAYEGKLGTPICRGGHTIGIELHTRSKYYVGILIPTWIGLFITRNTKTEVK